MKSLFLKWIPTLVLGVTLAAAVTAGVGPYSTSSAAASVSAAHSLLADGQETHGGKPTKPC